VLPPGTGLEPLQTALDALLDRVVKTNIEVQEGILGEAPPIAAIED
jgi:hypothetical protein